MNLLAGVLNRTVPISSFNKGMAGKIFEEVKKQGAKLVLKNNQPECVLLSPKEYDEMVEAINDSALYNTAVSRAQSIDPDSIVSIESIMDKFSITDKDLDGYEDVELE